VTDAHCVLGHLDPDRELGGGLRLDINAAERAVTTLPERAGGAAGILAVVRATMSRALRKVSTERGVDPAGLALVAYGGAGPLHATALARELGCRAVVVPPAPGVLSALGLLLAPARYEASLTVMAASDDLTDAWVALETQASEELERQGAAAKRLGPGRTGAAAVPGYLRHGRHPGGLSGGSVSRRRGQRPSLDRAAGHHHVVGYRGGRRGRRGRKPRGAADHRLITQQRVKPAWAAAIVRTWHPDCA
jgi:hypothetical protein